MIRTKRFHGLSAAFGVALLLALVAAGSAQATHGDPLTGQFGGTFRVAVRGSIDLNPFTATDADSWKVIPLVYDSLARIDPISLEPAPWAAASWNVSGSDVTVTLRSDLTFHDGSAVTAADVEYSYQQYRSAGLVPSDLVITTAGNDVTLSSATGGGLLFGEGLALPIVKSGTAGAPVGSGPWIPPANATMPLTLTANSGHFGAPFLEQATFSAYANTSAAAEGLLRGDVDLIGWPLLVDDPSAIIDVDGVNMTLLADANIAQNPGLTHLVVGFNMDPSNATSDDALRMAMAKTLNPNLYAQIYPSTRISRSPVIQANAPWYNPNVPTYQVTINAFPRSSALLTESLQSLDTAGYLDRDGDGVREDPSGSALSLTVVGIPVGENARTFTIQEAATDVFTRLGLRATLESEPSASILGRLAAGNYDVFIASLDTALDPAFLRDYLGSAGSRNYFAFADAQLDADLAAADAALDMAARKAAVQSVQLRAMNEGFMIPVLHFDAIEATVRGAFDGWVSMPGGVNNFWTYQNLHAAGVGQLSAELTLVPGSLKSGQQATAIGRVTDQEGVPVAGASASFWIGGAQVASGTTDAAGSVSVSIAAPAVNGTTDVEVTLQATLLGYGGATSSRMMTVSPDRKPLSVSVSSSVVTVRPGQAATITVQVRAEGQPVAGALVSLQIVGFGGEVADAEGPTDGSGVFTTTFTADVGPRTQFRIVATASLDGFTDGQGSTTVVAEQRVGAIEPRVVPGLDFGTILVAILAIVIIALVAVAWGRRKAG